VAYEVGGSAEQVEGGMVIRTGHENLVSAQGGEGHSARPRRALPGASLEVGEGNLAHRLVGAAGGRGA
jgi:hypothetical protein